MKIKNINNSTNFTSRNNPVRAFKYISDSGIITIREAGEKDLTAAAKFLRRFQALSYRRKHLYGKREDTAEARKAYKAINQNQWLKDIKKYLVNLLNKPDGNSTLLIALNDKDKIIGCGTMESIDGIRNKVGIIKDLHIEYEHRNNNLGVRFVDTLVQTARNQFKGVVAKNCGVFMDTPNPARNLGFEEIINNSSDATFLNKRYDIEMDSIINWLFKRM